MRRQIDISIKKQAKQQRAIATVDAIVKTAASILRTDGPSGFTANKVAEKAGVNISSFYQYFPNKEALLFHIAKANWGEQFTQLSTILSQDGPDNAQKLKNFIREFFIIEATEADLRRVLRIASIDLKDTAEYQELISKGASLFKGFIEDVVRNRKSDDLDFDVDFVVTLITSFAERTTDGRISRANLIRQADLLSEMLIAHFEVS